MRMINYIVFMERSTRVDLKSESLISVPSVPVSSLGAICHKFFCIFIKRFFKKHVI